MSFARGLRMAAVLSSFVSVLAAGGLAVQSAVAQGPAAQSAGDIGAGEGFCVLSVTPLGELPS
ncbi:MAG: hypothetical protein J6Y13_11895, partial [Treponema sp.]|nr:hypothetical protein [Treponema sp.]